MATTLDRETRIKRLYFRSAHRGSKETDIILGPYAAENLGKMNDKELDEFEAFLAESDNDIWDWVTGKTTPDKGRYKALITRLQNNYDVSK